MWNGEITKEVSKLGTEMQHYDGVYKFPDGAVFMGRVSVSCVHRTHIPVTPEYSEVLEHPCEPKAEFTGTWMGPDGGGYAPIAPPIPDELMPHLELLQNISVNEGSVLPTWVQAIKSKFFKS